MSWSRKPEVLIINVNFIFLYLFINFLIFILNFAELYIYILNVTTTFYIKSNKTGVRCMLETYYVFTVFLHCLSKFYVYLHNYLDFLKIEFSSLVFILVS